MDSQCRNSVRNLATELSATLDISVDSDDGSQNEPSDQQQPQQQQQQQQQSQQQESRRQRRQRREIKLPEHLVEEILAGNVVCFIGSGFSAASDALPSWQGLLKGIAQDAEKANLLSGPDATIVGKLGSSSSSHDLDMAAQILSDITGAKEFDRRARRRLTVEKSRLPERMVKRIKHLHGIPFCAILTTNLDNLLSGIDPQNPEFGPTASKILRETKSEFQRMQAVAFQHQKQQQQCPVIKIHGDVECERSKLVLTREGYRTMLHESTQYSTFLRTLLATKTVLFLGFSFTDAYINELRSEIVAMYRSNSMARASQLPLAYAIMPDVSSMQQQAMLHHEGLAVITFDTSNNTDFGGFDCTLEEIFRKTNPVIKFGRLMQGRKLLWLHTSWDTSRSTRYLFQFLEDAQRSFANTCVSENRVVSCAKDAIDALEERDYDCVICCLDGRPCANGEEPHAFQLLRAKRCKTPTLVFGHDKDTKQRTKKTINLGGRCYTSHYYELLSEIAFILESTS